jgi:hypothetical protein
MDMSRVVQTSLAHLVEQFDLHMGGRCAQNYLYCTPGRLNMAVEDIVNQLTDGLPGVAPRVHVLGQLEWSSHHALVRSLATELARVAAMPAPTQVMPNVEEWRLRQFAMRHQLPGEERVFIVPVPSKALSHAMLASFAYLRALISASNYHWIFVAPPSILRFDRQRTYQSAFHTVFRTYNAARA